MEGGRGRKQGERGTRRGKDTEGGRWGEGEVRRKV